MVISYTFASIFAEYAWNIWSQILMLILSPFHRISANQKRKTIRFSQPWPLSSPFSYKSASLYAASCDQEETFCRSVRIVAQIQSFIAERLTARRSENECASRESSWHKETNRTNWSLSPPSPLEDRLKIKLQFYIFSLLAIIWICWDHIYFRKFFHIS